MEKKIKFRSVYQNAHRRVELDSDVHTRPNQTLSVKEIYYRYCTGAPLPPMSVRRWQSDPEDTFEVIPDFNKMDLADLEEYKQELKVRSATLRKRIERAKREQKSAEEVPSSAEVAQPENV